MGGSRQRSKLFVAGLVGLGLLLVAVAAFTVVGVRATIAYRQVGAPEPTPVHVTVPIRPAGAAAPAGDASPLSPVRLSIELDHGAYELRPGPPGSDLTITGSFAANYYRLVHETDADGSLTIRLVSTAPLLARIISQDVVHDTTPKRLRIALPPDVPVALSLSFAGGTSDSELGGLHLTDLDTRFASGNHRLAFEAPLAAELQRVAIHGERGELEVHGLGNARFRTLQVQTSMGNHELDLSGDWRPGQAVEATFVHSIGNLVLAIPESVHVVPQASSTGVLGGIDGLARPGGETDDPDAPRLQLDLQASMGGGIRVQRN